MRKATFTLVLTLAAVSACSGGGNPPALPPAGRMPEAMTAAATPAPTPMPTIHLEPGEVNGLDNQFVAASTEATYGSDTSYGGRGQTVDGYGCLPSMVENKYHVHFFLGVLVNGKQIAIPDAIGLWMPGTESNGWTNSAHCYYPMHTHDASGLVHIESASTASLASSIANLGQFLDIWGERLTSTSFGPYSGSIHIFYARTNAGNVNSGTYYAYTGTTPGSIALYSHEVIWIEVGSTYVPASRLPHIVFYTQY